MEFILYTLDILVTLLGFLAAILWWFVSFLIFPLLVIAFLFAIALRTAYRSKYLRPYVEKLILKLAEKGQSWARRLVYLISVYPLRVLIRYIWFSIWKAILNLMWRPKWNAWQRARMIRQPIHSSSKK
jgi:hypothetical protein